MKKSKLASVLSKHLPLAISAAVALLSWAGEAQAGDCKNVKFHFKNEMSSKIKVRGVAIVGKNGSWTEDISNQEINTNEHYTTGGQTLQKLDSGEAPSSMTVNYDKWDAKNNMWQTDKSKKFTNRPVCSDGNTYNFVM